MWLEREITGRLTRSSCDKHDDNIIPPLGPILRGILYQKLRKSAKAR